MEDTRPSLDETRNERKEKETNETRKGRKRLREMYTFYWIAGSGAAVIARVH